MPPFSAQRQQQQQRCGHQRCKAGAGWPAAAVPCFVPSICGTLRGPSSGAVIMQAATAAPAALTAASTTSTASIPVQPANHQQQSYHSLFPISVCFREILCYLKNKLCAAAAASQNRAEQCNMVIINVLRHKRVETQPVVEAGRPGRTAQARCYRELSNDTQAKIEANKSQQGSQRHPIAPPGAHTACPALAASCGAVPDGAGFSSSPAR